MIPATAPWRNRSPGDLDLELPEMVPTEVPPVLESVTAAARSWARTPLAERLAALERAQTALESQIEPLAQGIAVETGKPLQEALGEVRAVVAKCALTAADAREHLAMKTVRDGPHPAWVLQRARGPAVVIGPFNFPLHLAHGALVAHLLAGNPVVFKPSPFAAGVAARYAELMANCFPKGVFGLVQGGAQEAEALCRDPRIRAIAFTGSVAVGRRLARMVADDFSKELALELGGRNAAIVCRDADLSRAASFIAQAVTLTCGQRCNATSWVLVEKAVAAPFCELLAEALREIVPGDPLRPETRLGPLIHAGALARYTALIAAEGDWVLPGKVWATVDGKRGHYVGAALRRGVAALENEPFAPVVDVEPVEDLRSAVNRHNQSPYGLSASVFTRSQSVFWELANELQAGNIVANLPTTLSPSTLPFGGWGLSGNGRPGGRGFVRFTTQEQALQIAADSFEDSPVF
jgi:succinylglutamic semialdehyde dehydrogenase